MPQAYVKKMASKHGISVDAAERKWSKAKKVAASQGHGEDYRYITGIFKNMIGESVVEEGKMSEIHMRLSELLDKAISEYNRIGGAEALASKVTTASKKIAKEFDIVPTDATKLVNDFVDGAVKGSVEEGSMPANVIKQKEKFRMMTSTELKAHIEKLAQEKGRTPTEQAERCERLHAVKPGTYTKHLKEAMTFKEYLIELSKGKKS